jgi:DNA invertase Pin-like site-specific DNA recombinase
MRTGISITLKPADRRRLKALARDRNTPHKHVWRAEIVLLSADGVGTNEIMRRTGKSKTCVWRWQERFMQAGWLTGWPTSACVQRIAIAVIYSA